MRDYAGPWLTGGWETRSEFGIGLRAAVTSGNKAKLTVYVDASAYDYSAGPSYNGWCDNSLIVSKTTVISRQNKLQHDFVLE